MRQSQGRLIAAGIAAVCGLGVAAMFFNMRSKPVVQMVETKIDTTQVLVAKTEVGLGQIVTPDNFRWQDWPQGGVPP